MNERTKSKNINSIAIAVFCCLLMSSCAYTTNEHARAMKFLQKSVKERDAMLLEQIKEDEKLEEAKKLAGMNEFLEKELVEVKDLNIKARPITKDDAIKASVVHYRKTGNIAPIIVNSELILYPYGLSEPKLVCAPLRICHVELEEGEEIIDTNPGDTQRWWFGYTFVGEGDHVKQNILVKPLVEASMETTLSVSTNKRLYYIILQSVTDGTYTKRIGFYYPQEDQKSSHSLNELRDKLYEYKQKDRFEPLKNIPVKNLNFEYDVNGKKRVKWFPERVFDDKQKVYIQMTDDINSYELPVFMIIGRRGQYEAVNYRYQRPYYIVDRLFDKGVLFLTNASGKEEKITIENKKRK